MKYITLGTIGQWIACVLLGVALATMIFNRWDASDSLITIGAVLFSGVTKLKLIGYEIEEIKHGRGKR